MRPPVDPGNIVLTVGAGMWRDMKGNDDQDDHDDERRTSSFPLF